MPELSNCTKAKDGKSYCFDHESGEVLIVSIHVEKAAIETVPKDVLLELLRKESKRN